MNVEFRDGLSVFSVPLPSRKESCEFVLKPVSHTVKDLVRFLQEEDKGIDRAAVYTEGEIISILHECQVWIDISVLMVTVQHHEAG